MKKAATIFFTLATFSYLYSESNFKDMYKIKDLTGNVYSRLTVISFYGIHKKLSSWNCKCECGGNAIIAGCHLRDSRVKSCGCLCRARRLSGNFKHGHGKPGHRTKEYITWAAVKQRCGNEKQERYKNYGGRGITMCDRWLNSYENFLADMGRAPSEVHSIERKDNNKGYCPENCRWATKYEQSRNKNNNNFITHNGATKCITDWALSLGGTANLIQDRLHRGWPIAKALTVPARKKVRSKWNLL